MYRSKWHLHRLIGWPLLQCYPSRGLQCVVLTKREVSEESQGRLDGFA